MATSSPDMDGGLFSGTSTCQPEFSDNFVHDIQDAVEIFVMTLSKIAKHHKRYVCFSSSYFPDSNTNL